jgi:hypothetical protein
VHSRAYIAFKTEDSVAKFSREYDGHIFKDKAGVYMRSFFFMLRLTSTRILDLRERITSRGRVCSISEVATGEEEGRQ